MRKSATASAPGKVIITGEHFVVHGSYAVAAAINKRANVSVSEFQAGSLVESMNKKSLLFRDDGSFIAVKAVARSILKEYGEGLKGISISVSSDIPEGSGLGSSAAVSIATAASMLKFFGRSKDDTEVSKFALIGEKEVHGNPSGIDLSASLKGGAILFNRKQGPKAISLKQPIPVIVVFSGKKRSTRNLVERVAKRRKDHPLFFESLTNAASMLSLDVVDALKSGDLPRLGTLMTVAQASLSWIGVSSKFLDRLIERASGKDSYGAKVTGAGGGGSIIVLPKPNSVQELLKSMLADFESSFVSSLPQEGLRWEA